MSVLGKTAGLLAKHIIYRGCHGCQTHFDSAGKGAQYRVGEREKGVCPHSLFWSWEEEAVWARFLRGEVDKHSILQCFPGGDSGGIRKMNESCANSSVL